MAGPTKRDLERENLDLRHALEEVYDRLAQVLGFRESDEEDGEDDDD